MNSAAARILTDLRLEGAEPDSPAKEDSVDVDGLIDQLSEAELREMLAELGKHDEAHP